MESSAISKCFTATVPSGKVQGASGLNSTCSLDESRLPSEGIAIQRCLSAPSDQSGELTW